MKGTKRLDRVGRMNNAKKWLRQQWPDNFEQAYCRRYSVSEAVAIAELAALGYWDEMQIQSHQQAGTEYEYRYDGYADVMKVVPKETEEWELFSF